MHLLVVDDEKNIRESIKEYFRIEKIHAKEAENGLSAQKVLQEEPFDGVILDLKMPGMNGLQLLEWMKRDGPDIPVIMISAFGDVEDAVEAMKQGAADYLVKPFDPGELVIRAKQAVERHRLRGRISLQGRDQSGHPFFEHYKNPKMNEIRKIVEKVAPTDSTVLITGESGTGKEVLARHIHFLSGRSEHPFVPINLGGIPESLVESELFGYEKGAFTGADKRKKGMFEMAASGSLFLDEIAEMPYHLQIKLLRVIQEKKIQRLGGTGIIPIDVRIIAATNKHPEELVQQERFREDLFYRLNVIRLHLPPLRERPEDIQRLAVEFIRQSSKRIGKNIYSISDKALSLLQRYRFPGNVRELENMIERAVILCDKDIVTERDFALEAEDHEKNTMHEGTLKELEREAIINALLRHEGKRQDTASELGITRRTLLNKIHEYGIEGF